MLSVKPSLEIFILRVNVVKDGISVNLMGGSKHNDLKVFVSFLQTLHNVRSYIDPSVNSLFVRKIYLQNDIWILSLNVIDAVNQCFVHIKYDKFLLVWVS